MTDTRRMDKNSRVTACSDGSASNCALNNTHLTWDWRRALLQIQGAVTLLFRDDTEIYDSLKTVRFQQLRKMVSMPGGKPTYKSKRLKTLTFTD